MSYTIEIKEEISKQNVTNSEMIAELSGFIRNNATISNETLFLTTENTFTIERLQSFFNKLYEQELTITIKDNLNFNKKNLYLLSLDKKVNFILQDIGYYDKDNNYKIVSDDLYKNGIFDNNDNEIANNIYRKVKYALVGQRRD